MNKSTVILFSGIILSIVVIFSGILPLSFTGGPTEFKNAKTFSVANTTYNLESNITYLKVYDSEKTYTENIDYTIDYQSGILEISNSSRFNTDSISVLYKYQQNIQYNRVENSLGGLLKVIFLIGLLAMVAMVIGSID